jgi:hypothetical protein
MANPTLAEDIAYAISCVKDYRDNIDPCSIEDVRTIYSIDMRIERLLKLYYQLTGFDPNDIRKITSNEID